MKKIYIAYTGGTIGMELSEKGYQPSRDFSALLLERISSINLQLPDFDIHTYDQLIDSSNITPDNWLQIANDIVSKYDEYAGFIILHGTDTMAYSCSMLSFMLRNLNKPVVFTGSQIPLSHPRSDAIDNILGALLVASDQRINEVCLYFNGNIMRGNRTTKKNAELLNAFDTPNFPYLGRLDIEMKLNSNLLLNKKKKPDFLLACKPKVNIGVLQFFPGITCDWIDAILSQPCAAFIIKTYGVGNGPDADKKLMQCIQKHIRLGKLIVNLTQCYSGSVNESEYATGSALFKMGVISGLDATLEATFCKLHYLYSQCLKQDQIIQSLHQSLAGEITL